MNTNQTKGMKSSEFREFFLDQIKDIYWAENHLHEALKKLEEAAPVKTWLRLSTNIYRIPSGRSNL